MDVIENVGDYLKTKRLEKGMSVAEVSDRTKIKESLIIDIEEGRPIERLEDVYVLGFIKNLCSLYGCSPEEVASAYQKKKEEEREKKRLEEERLAAAKAKAIDDAFAEKAAIREKKNLSKNLVNHGVSEDKSKVQVFLEGVQRGGKKFGGLKRFKKRHYALLASVLVVLVLLVEGITHYRNRERSNQGVSEKEVQRSIYKMTSGEQSFDLKPLDMVSIFYNGSYRIVFFKKKSDDGRITLEVNNQDYIVNAGDELSVDIDSDGAVDTRISFKKQNGDLAYILFSILNYENRFEDYEQLLKSAKKLKVGYDSKILEYQDKTPIELYVKATNLSSYISYITGGERQNKVLLSPGEHTFIIAEDNLEITLGNYRSLEVIVNKIPLDLQEDHDKFSVTKVIKWVKQAENELKYDLVIRDYVSDAN